MNRRNRNKSHSDRGKPTFKATAKAKAFSPRKTRLSKNDKKKLVEAVKVEVAESSKSKPKEKKRGNATTQNTMNLRLTEHGAGITEYISKHEGFSAIIKQRYSDFHVNEIDCDGNVVTLTTLEAPEAPVAAAAETKEDIDDYLKTTLSEEQYKTLMEIVDSNGEEVEIEATDMSKEDRRKLHTAIVKSGKSRLISNTVDKDGKKYIVVKRSSKAGKQERRSVPWPADRGGEYVYFILHKENMDTMETVNLIASRLRVKPNLITYAGMKDRRAKTSQLMCVWKVEPQRLVNVSRSLRGVEMGNYSFHQRPLRLGDLRGNRFRIVLRNVTGSDKQIEDGLTSLKTKGFLNYYGLQRFGSSLAVPTHEIGKALLLGNWQKAVELILKPRDGEPLRFLAEARKVWWETRDPAKAIKILRNKDKMIEGKLLLGLSRHGPKNYLNALDNIPRGTRLMYLHSYQSLIWNKVVSRRMQKFGLQPIAGDLVLQGEERAEPVELLEVGDHDATATQQTSDTADDNASNRQKPSVRILSESDVKDFTIYDIVLPLPGHDVVYPQNETKEWFEELLQADGLSPAKLKQSVRAYSVGGAYRHIAVRPTNVSWKIMHYSDPQTTLVLSDLEEMQKVMPPEDEKDGVYKALILDFCLPSSTYATMAVREVLKSDTSCYSQALLNDYHVPTGPNGTPKRRLSSAENGDSASSSVSEDVKTEPQDQVTSTKHQVSSICTRATKREKKTTDSGEKSDSYSEDGAPNKKKLKTEQSLSASHSTSIKIDVTPIPERRTRRSSRLVASDSEKDPSAVKNVMDTKSQSTGGGNKQRHVDKVLETSFQSAVDSKQCDLKVDRSTERTSVEVVPQNNKLNAPLQAHVTSLSVGLEEETVKKKLETEETNIDVGCDSDIIDSKGHDSSRKKLKVSVNNDSEVTTEHDSGSESSINIAVQAGKVECSVSSEVRTENSSGASSEQMYVESSITNTQVKTSITNTQISKEMHPCTQECNVMLQEKTVSSVLSSKLNGSETTDLKSTVGTVENVVCSSSEKTEILASIGCSHETDESCVTSSVLMETDTAKESHKTDRLQIQSDISKIHPGDGNESTKCELSCRESSTYNEETGNAKKPTVECAEALVSPFRHSEGSETSHLSDTEVKQNLKRGSGNTDASETDGGSEILKHSALDTVDQPDRQTESETETQISFVSEIKTDVETVAILSPVENPHVTEIGSQDASGSAVSGTVLSSDCKEDEKPSQKKLGHTGIILTATEEESHSSSYELCSVDCAASHSGFKHKNINKDSSELHSAPDCEDNGNGSLKEHAENFDESSNLSSLDQVSLESTKEEGSVEVDMKSRDGKRSLCKSDVALRDSAVGNQNVEEEKNEKEQNCADSSVNYFVDTSCKVGTESPQPKGNSLNQKILKPEEESKTVISPGADSMPSLSEAKLVSEQEVSTVPDEHNSCTHKLDRSELDKKSATSEVQEEIKTVLTDLVTDAVKNEMEIVNDDVISDKSTSDISSNLHNKNEKSHEESVQSEQNMLMESKSSQLKVNDPIKETVVKENWDKEGSKKEVHEPPSQTEMDVEVVTPVQQDIGGEMESVDAATVKTCPEKYETHISSKDKLKDLVVGDCCMENKVHSVAEDSDSCREVPLSENKESRLDKTTLKTKAQTSVTETGKSNVSEENCTEQQSNSSGKVFEQSVFALQAPEDNILCSDHKLHQESDNAKGMSDTVSQTAQKEQNQQTEAEKQITTATETKLVLMAGGSKICDGKCGDKITFKLIGLKHKLNEDETTYEKLSPIANTEELVPVEDCISTAHHSKPVPSTVTGKHCEESNIAQNAAIPSKDETVEYLVMGKDLMVHIARKTDEEHDHIFAHGCGSKIRKIVPDVTGVHMKAENVNCDTIKEKLCQESSTVVIECNEKLQLNVPDAEPEQTGSIAIEKEPMEGSDSNKEQMEAAGPKEQQVKASAAEEEQVEASAAEEEQVEASAAEEEQVEASAAEEEQVEASAAEEEQVEASAAEEEQVEAAAAEEGQVEAAAAEEGQVEAAAAEEGQVEAAAAEEGQVEAAAAEEGQVEAAAAEEGQVEAAAAEEGQVEAAAAEEGQVEAKQTDAAAGVGEQTDAAAGEGEQTDASARKEERVGLVVPEEEQLDAAAVEGEQIAVGASEVGKTESLDSGLEQTEAVGVKEGQTKAVETGSAPAEPVKTVAVESEQNLAMVVGRSESEALTRAPKQTNILVDVLELAQNDGTGTIPDQTLSVAEKRIGTVPANAETGQSEPAADDQEKMDEVAKEQGEIEVLCEDLEKTTAVDERPEKTQTVAEKLENVLGTAEEMEQPATAAEEPKLSKTVVGQAERRELEKKEPSVEELVQQGVSGELEAAEKPQKMEVMSSECKHIAPLTEERVQMMPVAEELERMEARTLEHLQMEATVMKQKQTGTVGKKQEEICVMAAMPDETETIEMKPERNIAATASSVELKKSGTVKPEKIEIAAAKPEGADTLLATAEQYHGETEIVVSESDHAEVLTAALEPDQAKAAAIAQEPDLKEAVAAATETIPDPTEALAVPAPEPSPVEVMEVAATAPAPDETEVAAGAAAVPEPEPDETEVAAGAAAVPEPEPDETEVAAGAAAVPEPEPDETEVAAGAAAVPQPEPDETEVAAGAAAVPQPEPDETEVAAGAAAVPQPEPDETEVAAGAAAVPQPEPDETEVAAGAAAVPEPEPDETEVAAGAAAVPELEPDETEVAAGAAAVPEPEPDETEVAAGAAAVPEPEPDETEVAAGAAAFPEPEPDATEVAAGAAAVPEPEPDQTEAAAAAAPQPDRPGVATAGASEPDLDEVAAASAAAPEPDLTEVAAQAAQEPDPTGVAAEAAQEPDPTGMAAEAAQEPDPTGVAAEAAQERDPSEVAAEAAQGPDPTEVVAEAATAAAAWEPDTTEAPAESAPEPDPTASMAATPIPDVTAVAAAVAAAPDPDLAKTAAGLQPDQTEAMELASTVHGDEELHGTKEAETVVDSEFVEAAAPVESDQTEAMASHVVLDHSEGMLADEERDQTEAVSPAVEPEQTEADRAAMELDQTESVETTVELDQTETVSATVEPYHTEGMETVEEPDKTEAIGAAAEQDQTEAVGAATEQVPTKSVGAAPQRHQPEAVSATVDPSHTEGMETVEEPDKTEAVGAAVEPDQTEAVGAAVEPDQTEAVGAAVEPDQTEAVGAAVEPDQTEAVGAAVEPDQTEAVGAAVEPDQTEAVGAAVEPDQTEAVGAAVEPDQTEAVGAAVEPDQTEAVGAAVEPDQTEAVGAAVEPDQTEAVGAAVEPDQTEAVGAAVEPDQTEAVGAAVEPDQTEAVGAAVEPDQTEAVGAAVEPDQTEAVGAAVEPDQTEALGAAVEPDQTEAVGAAVEPDQTEAVGAAVEPDQTEAVGAAVEPDQTEEVGAAVEPDQTEAVGAAVEPDQTEAVGAAVEPDQTEAVGAAVEPDQTEAVGAAVEPDQTEAVGAAVEPDQTEAVGAAVEPDQTEAVGAAVEPDQTEAVGAAVEPDQTEAVGAAVEPDQTEAVGAAVEPDQTEAVGAAVEPDQTEAVGAAVEPDQTEAVGAAVEPDQTEAVGAAVEPDQTEAVGAAVEPDQTEAVGAAVETDQTEAVGAAVETDQTEAVGAAVETDQTQAVGAAVETDQTQAVGAAVEPDQTQAVGAAVEPDQTQAVGAAVEPDQTEAVGAAVEPDQTEAVGAAVEPDRTEAVGAAVEPDRTEAVGAAVEPDQTEALGAAVEPDQTEAVGAAVEPHQTEAVGAVLESCVIDSLSTAVEPDQTETLPVVTEPDQTEALPVVTEPDQTEALLAATEPNQTEALLAATEPNQTEALLAATESHQTEAVGAGVESHQTEAVGAAVESHQTEAVEAAVKSHQTEAVEAAVESHQTEADGAAVEPDQTEAVGAVVESCVIDSLSAAVEPDQTETLSSATEPDETEALSAPAERDQIEAVGVVAGLCQTEAVSAVAGSGQTDAIGAAVEQVQTEEAGAPAEPDQTEEAGAPAEPDQTEEAGAPAEPDQTEEAGAPAEPDQTEEAGAPAEPDQTEEAGAPAEPDQTEEAGAPAEPDQTEEAGAPAEPDQTEEAGAPAEPDQTEEAGAPAEPDQTEEAGAPAEPDQTEEAGAPAEPDQTEEAGAPAEPDQTEEAGAPAEPDQTEEAGAPAEPDQTEAAGAPAEPDQTEAAGAAAEPAQKEATRTPAEPDQTEAAGTTAQFFRYEVVGAYTDPDQSEVVGVVVDPDLIQAAGVVPRSTVAVVNAGLTEAEMAMTEPRQTKEVAKPVVTDLSVEIDLTEKIEAAAEPGEVEANHIGTAVASGQVNIPLESNQTETVEGINVMEKVVSGADLAAGQTTLVLKPCQSETSMLIEVTEVGAASCQSDQTEASAAEPEQTEASAAEPEQTEASAAEPEQTEASAAEPEQTEASAAEPEQTEASAAEPEQTEASAAEPEQTEASAAEPEQTEASAAEPGQTEASAAEPGQTEASAAEPGQTEASAAEPGQTEASAAEPGQTEASAAEPGQTEASAAEPGQTEASAAEPGQTEASAAEPGQTEASAAEPGQTEASAAEPGQTEASAAEPGQTEASAAEPGQTEASAAEPGQTEASAAEPGQTEASAAEPGQTEASAAEPGQTEASAAEPGQTEASAAEPGQTEASGAEPGQTEASGAEPGQTEASGAEPGQTEASGAEPGQTEASAAEPGQTEASGAEPGQTEASGAEPGQTEASGAEPGQTEASGAEPGQTEASGAEPGQTEASGAEPGQTEASGAEPGQTEASGAEPGQTEASGAEPGQTEASGAEPGQTEASGAEPGQTEASGAEPGQTEASGAEPGQTEASGAEPGQTEASGAEPGQTEASGAEPGQTEASGAEPGQTEASGAEPGQTEASGAEPGQTEASGAEPGQTEASGAEPGQTEASAAEPGQTEASAAEPGQTEASAAEPGQTEASAAEPGQTEASAAEPGQTEASAAEPGQTEASAAEPGQTEASAAEPGQTEASAAEPGQTEASAAEPGQTEASAAEPGQTEASGAGKEQSEASAASRSEETEASAASRSEETEASPAASELGSTEVVAVSDESGTTVEADRSRAPVATTRPSETEALVDTTGPGETGALVDTAGEGKIVAPPAAPWPDKTGSSSVAAQPDESESPTATADSVKCEEPAATGESDQSDDLAVAAQPDKSEAAATEQSGTPKSFVGVDKFKLCNQVGSSDKLSSSTERSSQADQQLPPLTDSDQIKATESSVTPEISKEGSSADKAETGDTGLVYHSSSSLKRKAVSPGSDADNLKDYVKPCKLVKSSDVPDTTSSKMEKSYGSQEVGEDVKISNINVEECELVEKKESDISSTAVSTLCMEETLSSVDREHEESSSLGMGVTETEQLSKSVADTLCGKMADTEKEVCNSPCKIDLKNETAEGTGHTLPSVEFESSVANSLSLVRDSASENIGPYVSSAREEVNTSCVTEEISDVDQTLKATKVENEVFPCSEESNEISVHHERCHTEQSSSVTPELNSGILERSLEENVLKNKVAGDLLSLEKADTLVDLESQPVCAAETETTNSVQPLTCKSQEKCQSQITPNVDICATVQIAGNKNSFSDITDEQMEIESKPGGETPEPSASEIEEKDEPSSEVTTETAAVLPLHPTLHSEEIIPMDVDKNVQSVTPSEYGIISKSSLTEKSALDIEVAVIKIEDAVQCEPNTTNVVPQASNTVSARQEQLHAATDAAANLSASAETKLGLARELSDDMGKKEVSSKFVDVFPQSVQNTTVLPPEKTSSMSISNTSAELITSSVVPLCVEPILTSDAPMSQAITSTKDKVPDQQNATRISPLTASATIIDEGKFPKDTVAVPLPSDDVEMSKPNINPVDNSLEPSDGSPCNIRKTLKHETETSSVRVCLQTDSSKHVSSSDRMDTNLETVHVVLSTSEIAPMSPVTTVASSKTEEIKALEELKAQGVVPHEKTTAEIAASSAITENKGTLPAEDHWGKKELLGDRKPAVSSDKPVNEKTECKNTLMATSVSVKATLSPSESDEVCEETSQVTIEGTIISDGAVSTPYARTDSEVGHENVEQVKRTGEIVLEKGNKAGSESLPKMGVHQTHSRPEPLTQPESALSVAPNVTKNLTIAKTEVEELQMPEVAFCSDKLSGASEVGTDKMPSSINTHTSKAAELSKETTNETGTAMLDLKELAHSQADETLVPERTFVSDDEAEVKSEEPKLCTVSENNLTTSQTVTETLEVTKSSETAQSMKALTKPSNKSTVVSSHSEAETSVVDAKSKVVTSTVEIVSEKLESMVPPLNQFTGEQLAMASEGTEQEMKTTGLQIPRGTTEVPGVPGLDITAHAVLSSQMSQNMMLKLEKDQKETETPVSETEILQQVDRCLETKEPSNMCVDKNELETTSSKALKTTVEPNKLSGIEMPLGRTSLTADVQEIEAPHTPAVKSEESVAHASDQLSEQQDCGGKRKLSQERPSEQAVKSEVTKQTVTDVPSVLDCEIPAKMIECVHAETSSNKEQGQNAQKTLVAPELGSSSVHESSEIVKDSVTPLDSSCAMPEEVETAFTSESETSTRSKLVATIEMEEERQMIVVKINKSGEVEQSLKGNDTQSVKVSCVESEKRLASQQAILEKTEKSLQSCEVPTSTGLISEELFVRKTADDTSELSGKASVNQGSVSISISPRSSDETSLFEKVATKEIGSDGISASQNSLTAKNKVSVDCSTSEFVPEKTNSETAETETAGEILLQSSDLIKTSEHHFMKEKTNEEAVELCAASKKFKGTELCLAQEDVPDCDKKVDQKLAKQDKIQDTPTNVDSVLLSTSLQSSVEEKVIENSESSLGTAGNHLSQSAASEESKPDVKCVSSEDDGNSCEKEDTEKNQTHSPTSDPLAKENESDSQARVKHKVNSDTDSERTEVSIKRKVWESENETEVSPKKVKIDDCNIGISSISDSQCSKSPESLKRKSASDDAETGDQESNTEKKKPKVETSEQ